MREQIFAGKYVVQEEIARGGMGVIYKALDRTLNRIVAIKQIHSHLSGDPSFAERFLREARAMARLQHDNIVSIYAVEEDQRTQFLVMEFFGPNNLRTLIRQPYRLPLGEVVRIGEQLASALAYAHGQGIIHRDIKPANVLIDKRGKTKLTDFGIAAALDEASITSTGQVIGTPEYMSPEQARGVKLDGRSDLYSLGIMLYEMVDGKPLYPDASKTAILGKLTVGQQDLSLQFPAGVPAMLQGVIQDLLRRNPEDRIPDADTLTAQLHEILYILPHVETPSSPEETAVLTTALQKKDASQGEPVDRFAESTRHFMRAEENTRLLELTSRPVQPIPLPFGLEQTAVLPGKLEPLRSQNRAKTSTVTPGPARLGLLRDRLIRFIGGSIVLASLVFILVLYLLPGTVDDLPKPIPFPDAHLSALLEKFQQAYERCDLDTLRSISLMSERRANNVEFMCSNYNAFTATIEHIAKTEEGATAVLALVSGTRKNGETIPIDSLTRNNKLQIPRREGQWDKIVW
jgi:serine/threonine protein kinase